MLISWSVNASPEIQTWETSNGVPVYYVHAPELPMVDIQVVFDAGSSRDGDKPGLAMLTTGLLSQGAGGKDADAISNGFESLGAVYGADTGYDSSSVSLRSLTEEDLLTSALANLELVMTQPDFPKEALERRRSRTLIGLRSKQQSPGALAQDAFMEAVYNAHPYARPSEGTEESIKAISREDVVGFFKQYFVASNAMVAMVGAVDRARAEAIAEQLTSVLPKGEKPEALPGVSML
ncbi:MAG: pitrilysin family protein, partial [Gammaproteobacteria bacterium]